MKAFTKTDWHKGGLVPLELSYDMTMDDLQFSMPMGVKMRNAVIMEPYMIEIDNSMEQLSFDHDESYLTMLDRQEMARQYDDKRVCLKRAGICKLLYDGRHCRDWKK